MADFDIARRRYRETGAGRTFAFGCTMPRSISNGLYRLVVSKGQPPRAEHFSGREGAPFLSCMSASLALHKQERKNEKVIREGERKRAGDKGVEISYTHPGFDGSFQCDVIFYASRTRSWASNVFPSGFNVKSMLQRFRYTLRHRVYKSV